MPATHCIHRHIHFCCVMFVLSSSTSYGTTQTFSDFSGCLQSLFKSFGCQRSKDGWFIVISSHVWNIYRNVKRAKFRIENPRQKRVKKMKDVGRWSLQCLKTSQCHVNNETQQTGTFHSIQSRSVTAVIVKYTKARPQVSLNRVYVFHLPGLWIDKPL